MTLSRQLFLLIAAIVVMATVLVSLLVTSLYRQVHLNEAGKHGAGLHLMLAETIAREVIQGRALEVSQLLKQAKKAEPDIIYLYVTDFDGRLFAHTFAQGFPRALLPTLEKRPTGRVHRQMRARSEIIEHYSAPLIEGMYARFYLGIGDRSYRHNLAAMFPKIILGTGLTMIITMFLGALLVRRISNPLASLTSLTYRFARDQPIDLKDVPVTGSNEIRQLGKAFSHMVSQRRSLEEDIRERERFLNRLFESSPIGLALCKLDGTLVKVNSAFSAILGRSVDETLGLTYWEITPDKYQEQEQLQLRFLEEKGSYGPYEKEYIHKDGSLVPVRLSGMLVEQKGERFIWSSVEDISALHQASMLERRLRQIFEYSYEEFYLFDGESLRFIQVSRGALDNLGYGPEEIEALTPLDLKTDYTPKDFAKLIAPLRHGKQPLLVFETRHRRKDGSFYPVEVRLQYSKEQGRSFFFAMIVDLTERRRIEKELADHRAHLEALVVQRTAQLEVANRELEAFSYSVSHDLRAPLRAIDGFSLALMEDYGQQLDETALDFLQRIRGGAQKMSQLIDDLLQLSRINKGELKWMPVDLAILAASVWEELQAVEPQREVELILGENLEVEGDPRQLRILLNNLLGNAWKFTSRKAQGRVVFERDHDDPSVFTIADNGAGFDMRYVDKLFGAFQRLHRTTEFPGTGVGLAIVQRIIHRHGGRIWAKGEVGHGATFYFSLGVGEVTQTRPLQENERGAYHA